jgi:diadenosine tetraphosphatase ApaH/serine/threonine PP2A family protein phosphatase
MAALWTQKNLTPTNLEWLKALPQGPVKPDDSLDLACVHGSPEDEDEYLINVHDAVEPLAHPVAHCTFFGHTHLQGGFAMNGTGVENLHPSYRYSNRAENIELPLAEGTTYMINPGSIGQPRDGDPRSAFALYDTESSVVHFYRLPYDIAGAQKQILDAGLPPRLAERLSGGR